MAPERLETHGLKVLLVAQIERQAFRGAAEQQQCEPFEANPHRQGGRLEDPGPSGLSQGDVVAASPKLR